MEPELQDAVDNVKKNTNARKTTKFVARLVIGHCAASVVKTIIKSVHPEPEGKTDQVKLELGSYAIGAAVAMKAKRVIDHDVDDCFDIIDIVRRNFKKTKSNVVQGEVIPDNTPSE